MTNFSAKILNNSVSALSAQQAVIATTANNISNVNTPGYSRRVVGLETRSGGGGSNTINVGNGVSIGAVQRIADQFLEKMLVDANSDHGAANARNEVLDQVQRLFNLTGDQSNIGSTLRDFFSAADDLALNPSSIELRTNFIATAQNLVDTIRSTYQSIANLQTQADQRISNEMQNVNGLLTQIGALNRSIASREATGSEASDDRDQRQVLLNRLAEKMNFSSVEQSDGSVTLTLPNGFTLVNQGDVRTLSTTSSPSFVTTAPPSLSGQSLSYIVFDYSSGAGTQQIDLTQQFTGGSIGGLLSVRGHADPSNTSAFQATGTLVEVAARVESLARGLLTTVNSTYLGPDRDTSTPIHNPSSGDLDGLNPAIFGLFSFSGAPTSTSTGLPVLPTDIDNFASRIGLATTNPRRIAAARDSSGGAPNPASYALGDGSNIKAIANLQGQTNTFSLGGYTFVGTFDDSYSELVTKVGTEKSRAETDAKVASGSLEIAQNKREEVSGVSLDEEFAGLIKFQKAYQAAARMLRVGQELLDEVIRLL